MTKIGSFLISFAAATVIAFLPSAGIAHGNERGSVKATIGGAHITIDYGRPALRGRDMVAQIQPGQLWRIGADAPATLDSDRGLNFGGTIIPKGKHVLEARMVAPGRWTLVFSSSTPLPPRQRVKPPEVPLTFQETADSVELVTIGLTDQGGTGVIDIAWGKLHLSASFTPV